MSNSDSKLLKKAGKSLKKHLRKTKCKGSFMSMPYAVLDSGAYLSLTQKAKCLLYDMFRQYNGYNNGDFECTFKLMKKKGWVSKDTLSKACEELLQVGLLYKTRQGGRNQCSLFAVTWRPINDCGGKHDVKPSGIALGYWKIGHNPEQERVGDKAIFLPHESGQPSPIFGVVTENNTNDFA